MPKQNLDAYSSLKRQLLAKSFLNKLSFLNLVLSHRQILFCPAETS